MSKIIPYLEPKVFLSPQPSHTNLPSASQNNLSTIKGYFTHRNASLPGINQSISSPLPANVITILPKSDRMETLRIFKAKIQEEKEHVQKELEQPKIKKNPYEREIKRKDTKSAVDSLVEKSKQDYQKKKKSHLTGSMYINDLWGKRYEVSIRKQAKIDVELQGEQDKKRRPLQMRLDEATSYFEQKFPMLKEPSQMSCSNSGKNSSVMKEIGQYCETEYSEGASIALLSDRMMNRVRSEDYLVQKKHHIVPRLPPIKQKGTLLKQIQQSSYLKSFESSAKRKGENSGGYGIELGGEDYFPDDKYSQSPLMFGKEDPGVGTGSKTNRIQRDSVNERKEALNYILTRCEFEVQENTGWMNEIEDCKNLFQGMKNNLKKKQLGEKRKEIINLCKFTIEKKASRSKRYND